MTPLHAVGAGAVADAWNASVGAKYRIDAGFVQQNLLDHPLFDAQASLWLDGSFVAVKRNAASLYEGPDPKAAHLSLLGGSTTGIGSILPEVKERLLGEGYESLVLGQDSGHFLPGAPTDIPWMGLFLKAKGFESGGLAFDLERDLGGLPLIEADQAYEYRNGTDADVEAVEIFLKAEFPGRWRYDVMGKINEDGPKTVFGLFQAERCSGFALLQSSRTSRPIGGGTWREALGDRWGSLGPIGISRHLRGAGLGKDFLNRALIELRSRDVRRAIIDWTELVDFYGTQGFSVNRAYRSYRLSLSGDPRPSA